MGLCCNYVFQLREFLRQERERQAAEAEARRALEEERRRLEEERLERVRKYVKKNLNAGKKTIKNCAGENRGGGEEEAGGGPTAHSRTQEAGERNTMRLYI